MTFKPCFPIIGLGLLTALSVPGPAWADAIDGHWCNSDGRKFTIDGSRIVTPAGTRTTGDYDRHAFSYTVPSGDPGAGSVVSMDLVDEDTVHLWTGNRTTDPGPVQIWQRCSNVTS